MDVITISSDSEASCNGDNVANASGSPTNLSNEVRESCHVDRKDGDVRPPMDYDTGMGKIKVRLSNEIEDFVTPRKLSQSSPRESTDDDIECITLDSRPTNNLKAPKADSLSSPSDLENGSQNINFTVGSPSKANRRQKLSQQEKELAKLEKEQRKMEREKLREKKKAEQLKQKALKAAFFENQRNLRPEENIKCLKVHIDNDIVNSAFGGNVISILQQNNIRYLVESQRKNCTVSWSKQTVEKFPNEFGELTERVEAKEENILLYVLTWERAIELIHENDLLSHVQTVASAYTNKKLTLVIYGLGKYFTYKKNRRNADFRAEVNNKKKARCKASERVFEEAHTISGDQLEFALTELQLVGKYNCRLAETPEELSALILHFTKSLSQIDFKAAKQKRQNADVGWVNLDSSGQSVKVDRNGNGLLNLWHRQICQFSSVGPETAEAIVSHYNSPTVLLSEMARCGSEKEGALLLQNIQIRRNGGLVSSSRRVGPQLSKKIYKFFTSDDPDVEL